MFKDAYAFVRKYEGGLVDHPQDPGGITNLGISLKAYPQLGVEGIRNMTHAQAEAIYKRDYWEQVCPDWMPDSACTLLFDCAVNQGVGFARKALQRAVGARPDGLWGPATQRLTESMDEKQLVIEIALHRMLHYAGLGIFKTFGKGWTRRLLHCFALSIIQTTKD